MIPLKLQLRDSIEIKLSEWKRNKNLTLREAVFHFIGVYTLVYVHGMPSVRYIFRVLNSSKSKFICISVGCGYMEGFEKR